MGNEAFENACLEMGTRITVAYGQCVLRNSTTLLTLPFLIFQGFPAGGIHIFGSQLHTHGTGIEVETRHFRDGQEMPQVNKDPHYSAHFQEIRPLRDIITVLPVRCYFKTFQEK